jgi:hypothetical protein
MRAAHNQNYWAFNTLNTCKKENIIDTIIGTEGNSDVDILTRIKKFIDSPSKNSVLCIKHILTALPELFPEKSDTKIYAWAARCLSWLQGRYGVDNVVNVALYCDGFSSWLVAYVVPELNGFLNAQAFLGSSQLINGMQKSYAETMMQFSLELGIHWPKIRRGRSKRGCSTLL